MQASAVIVIGNQFASAPVCDFVSGQGGERTRVPTACLEILGRSVLELTIARLRHAGTQAISVIAGANWAPCWLDRDVEIVFAGRGRDCWVKAAHKLKEDVAQGVENVVLMELGAYVECDFADALQFHRSRRNSLTQFEDRQQPLEFWVVSAAAIRASASDCMLPFGVDEALDPAASYPVMGYVNRVSDARDLRRLVVDAFLGHCAICPRGREIRPGVWVDDGARPHRSARILAPAYLGRFARLRRSAVITRFTNIERNCCVGAGTVVDSASILPYTTLGKGLDISHAVIHGDEFVDLTCNLALKIDDPRLIRGTATQPRLVPKPKEQFEPADGMTKSVELERGLQGEV